MASVFRRGRIWWIKYHADGVRVQESLHTANERIARSRLRQAEYLLETRGLVRPSETPLAEFLEDFCAHLRSIRTYHAYSCIPTQAGTSRPRTRECPAMTHWRVRPFRGRATA
jgi:hypothetical protein